MRHLRQMELNFYSQFRLDRMGLPAPLALPAPMDPLGLQRVPLDLPGRPALLDSQEPRGRPDLLALRDRQVLPALMDNRDLAALRDLPGLPALLARPAPPGLPERSLRRRRWRMPQARRTL